MNIYLDLVGCRLNQAEIEGYARRLRAAGHTIVAQPDNADLYILNSCTVTGEAASDSRQKVRQAAHVGAEVIITGCWSSLDPAAAGALPGVKMIVPNEDKDQLVERILGPQTLEKDLVGREPLAGDRSRTRAFIKVQDGCDNHCTYCITRLARGASHSRPVEAILDDIRFAIAGSAREAVLTGVQIGSWGRDLGRSLRLSGLIRKILTETDIPRLRISSIEPWEVDDDLISLWKDSRLCRHIHIPLQSGSPGILQKMARRTHPQVFLDLVHRLRTAIPGISITTDIIVGFPGETANDFLLTLELIKEAQFSGGHVFTFSARPGTPAQIFPDQIAYSIRRQRSRDTRAQFQVQAKAYRERFLGQILDVLWEKSQRSGEGWILSGLSDNYINVRAVTPGGATNRIDRVLIRKIEGVDLIGEVISNEP